MLSDKLLVLLPLAAWAVLMVSGQSFCGDNPITWRNDNLTCPARAVCADVFTGERNWGNGTRCESRITLSNCLCEGNTACPIGNPSHRLSASRTHERYTCEPVCNLPYCNNVPDQVTRSGGRVRPTSLQSVSNSVQFDRRIFYRMECRCPRHHAPVRGRTVKTFSHQYNYITGEYLTLYTCNSDNPLVDRQIPDPCDAQK